MSLLETRLSLYLMYVKALEEVRKIEMRGFSARWPWKETRNRENESHGGVHSGSRYRAALYAELKGYGEILWGRGRSHASFSAASLPLSLSLLARTKKKHATPNDLSLTNLFLANFLDVFSLFNRLARKFLPWDTCLAYTRVS